ncbi:hypothetical protein PG996_008918 [Apiospora saccharicola]|uniref:Uncharacterized protein n=1 Tax=Apiospora saccharicola TaxID=335842 RepID=A0ABR1V1V1_9PEZI
MARAAFLSPSAGQAGRWRTSGTKSKPDAPPYALRPPLRANAGVSVGMKVPRMTGNSQLLLRRWRLVPQGNEPER